MLYAFDHLCVLWMNQDLPLKVPCNYDCTKCFCHLPLSSVQTFFILVRWVSPGS